MDYILFSICLKYEYKSIAYYDNNTGQLENAEGWQLACHEWVHRKLSYEMVHLNYEQAEISV